MSVSAGKRECKTISLLGLDVCMKAKVPEKKTAKLVVIFIALFLMLFNIFDGIS